MVRIKQSFNILAVRNCFDHVRIHIFTSGRHTGESPDLSFVHDERLRSDLPIFFTSQNAQSL